MNKKVVRTPRSYESEIAQYDYATEDAIKTLKILKNHFPKLLKKKDIEDYTKLVSGSLEKLEFAQDWFKYLKD